MKTRILIAGIGGVGGYFGGLLAKSFENSNEVEIIFLARSEHLKMIQQNGLKVITKENEFIAKPFLVTDDANKIGVADYILVCTKSYDLEKTIQQLKPCVNDETVVIPFLNGVDSVEIIKSILPNNLVAGGCVYIVSSIKEAGVLHNSGNIQTLYFGLDNNRNEKLEKLQTIFQEAKIESTLSQNITPLHWEKFLLIGANSTATSYFNNTTGEILANEQKEFFLFSLLNEVNAIALAKGVSFNKDMIEVTTKKLKSFPFETISSLQRDFWKQEGKTELETITGFVVKAGKLLNVPTPTFEIAYNHLLKQKL